MNLTIEKAKELLKTMILSGDLLMNRDRTYDECINFENKMKAKGFIEGWNQAIKKVIEEINLQPKPYTVSGIIEREELRYILNGLKVKGEK